MIETELNSFICEKVMGLGDVRLDYAHREVLAREALRKHFRQSYFDMDSEMDVQVEWHEGNFSVTMWGSPSWGYGPTVAWAICEFIQRDCEYIANIDEIRAKEREEYMQSLKETALYLDAQ